MHRWDVELLQHGVPSCVLRYRRRPLRHFRRETLSGKWMTSSLKLFADDEDRNIVGRFQKHKTAVVFYDVIQT